MELIWLLNNVFLRCNSCIQCFCFFIVDAILCHYTRFLYELILSIDREAPSKAPCWNEKKSRCRLVCSSALQWRGMEGLPVLPQLPTNRKASVHRADNKICSVKPLINKLSSLLGQIVFVGARAGVFSIAIPPLQAPLPLLSTFQNVCQMLNDNPLLWRLNTELLHFIQQYRYSTWQLWSHVALFWVALASVYAVHSERPAQSARAGYCH